MSRGRKQLPFIEDLEIIDVADRGKSLGKHDGRVVFVSNAVPGDVCDVQVFKKKKGFFEGRVTDIKTYSDKRTEPFCQYFGTCGGCKWQNLKYDEQLNFKQNEVENQLKRIGKVELPEITPILPSKQTDFYRNKLEYSFSHQRWLTFEEKDNEDHGELRGLGFHVPGRFDKVVDIDKCWLQAEPSNAIRNEVRRYALEHDLSFFNIRVQEGFLRTMIIRTSTTGEVMVIMTFFHEDVEAREKLLNHLKATFSEITSLMYVINEKGNDSISDQEVILHSGKDHILEKMEDIQFKIGPKSFYQTNSEQAYELYKITRDYAGITSDDVVYDLYTGTGTIANFVAKQAKKVVGIEYVPEAIEDAKVNSEFNGINNTSFYAGDMKKVLTSELIEKEGKPDIIITDPARAGMDSQVVERILEAAPKKVIYVSCNAATQARDISLMSQKYKVVKFQPVDMFPHTHHVESVVLLELIR